MRENGRTGGGRKPARPSSQADYSTTWPSLDEDVWNALLTLVNGFGFAPSEQRGRGLESGWEDEPGKCDKPWPARSVPDVVVPEPRLPADLY